eukprot:18522-Pelagococcus_subviridis.AAC.9
MRGHCGHSFPGARVAGGCVMSSKFRRADAIRPGVAAADDDDVLLLRVDVVAVLEVRIQKRLRVRVEELHREVHALEVAPLHGEVARLSRAAREDDGIRRVLDVRDGRVPLRADVRVGHELDPLRGEDVHAALHNLFLVRFHVRNAVHHEAADAVGALVHGDGVPGFVELVRGGETRGTRADYGHLLPRARRRRRGDDPSLLEPAVDDRALHGLDRDRVLDDPQRARPLARRRAHAAGELGEVVRLVETVQRVAPPALVHELVPLRDLVAEGAPAAGLVAVRRPAVHASRALRREEVVGHVRGLVLHDFLPVLEAFRRVAVAERLALVLDEAANLLRRRQARRAGHDVGLLVRERRDRLERLERVLLLERLGVRVVLLLRLLRFDDLFVIARNFRGDVRIRALLVLRDEPVHERLVLVVLDRVEVNLGPVAVRRERPLRVVHVRDAAGHPRREVPPGGAEDAHDAARHVLAAVVADALDDGVRARVADAETLRGDAAEERLPRGRAVQRDVPDDDRAARVERRVGGRADDDFAAAEALADVVVRVAGDLDGDALARERAEGLPRAAVQLHRDRARGQALCGVLLRDLVRQHRPHRAVHVFNLALVDHLLARLDRGLRRRDERVIERELEAVVLLADVAHRRARADARGRREEALDVDPRELPARVDDVRIRNHQVASPHELVHGGVSHRSHVPAEVLREEEEEVHDVILLALELGAEGLVLRRDPDRARVLVALPHHDAPHRHERRGGEAPLFRAEERRDEKIPTRLELAVRLQHGAAAEVVRDERLLRLREPEFPRKTRGFDPGPPRRASAAVVSGDEDVVGFALDNARGDRPDAVLGDELDADARGRVRVLRVVDQLREIFDGVDVVMRRRRHEADAGGGHPRRRNVALDLRPGELAALAGLRALRHLDLDLVAVAEVVGGDAEAPGRDLLDRGPLRVVRAVRLRDETLGVLAALSGVRLAAEPVHRPRERRVRFQGDRTVRHRAGAEPLHDLARGLDRLDRHGLAVALKLEHAAEVAPFVELVRDVCVLAVLRRGVVPARRL